MIEVLESGAALVLQVFQNVGTDKEYVQKNRRKTASLKSVEKWWLQA